MRFRIGWFTTARDRAAIELFNAVYDGIKSGEIKGEISFVFSNREENESVISDEFFALVRGLKIPLVAFSSQKFKPEMRTSGKKDEIILNGWRSEYDREVIERIKAFEPDIIILAGYMLIVSGELCRRFNMLNLHPAIPGGPIGTWQEVIWQLIKDGRDRTGAMMHFVTEELDKGPPATYYTFSIQGGQFTRLWKELEENLRNRTLSQIIQEENEGNPLFALIRAAGAKREIPLIFNTIKEFAGGKLRIEDGKVMSGDEIIEGGYCLNEDIEEYLKRLG